MSERREVSTTVQGPDGQRTITILSSVSPDDLVRVMLKVYVYEARKGVTYVSPFSRSLRDQLVRVRTPQRSL